MYRDCELLSLKAQNGDDDGCDCADDGLGDNLTLQQLVLEVTSVMIRRSHLFHFSTIQTCSYPRC